MERTVWDGDQVIFEIRAKGGSDAALSERESDNGWYSGNDAAAFGQVGYVHAGGIDQPLLVLRAGFNGQPPIAVYPHQNWRGMFELGTASDGTLRSSTIGYPQIAWPGAQATLDGELPNKADGPVWFGSLIPGKSDASGMQYMRNRYYDPGTGRFTQEDPIGLAGGMNLYGFAAGDPVNFSDPFGLCPNCRDQTAAEGMEVVKRALAVAAGVTKDKIKYGQDRDDSSVMDCSLFVCKVLNHPHSGAHGGGGHLTTGDLDGNSDFRVLGAGEAPQPGDVLRQPRNNGGAHVGIFTGVKNSNGGLLGLQMGNSGANIGIWGVPIKKGTPGMGWFEGSDKLTIFRPQRPK